jgi:8-amino-7-oxononanoate synthase
MERTDGISHTTYGGLGSMTPGEQPWAAWLQRSLRALSDSQLERRLVPLIPKGSVRALVGGREVLLFSGNDYLGLSHHPEVREAVATAVAEHGLGPRGSALICGYTHHHEKLEHALSELKGTESALVFPTGFAVNLAILSCLAGNDVAIFSDALNHASIIDGCRLAQRQGATVAVYRHSDATHLEQLLAACTRPLRVIVTDGLFSMDGDQADLKALVALKKRYESLLVVDEAHGTLVFGASGGGVAEALGVSDDIDLHVGTLSKALGAQGGFVASSKRWRQWILNRGRAYMYSTALSLPNVLAATSALKVARREPQLRNQLWKHIERLSACLGKATTGPILPWIVGEQSRAMALSAALLEQGFHVTAIRPPTVPAGTSRLRITLSAAHSDADVDALIGALGALS